MESTLLPICLTKAGQIDQDRESSTRGRGRCHRLSDPGPGREAVCVTQPWHSASGLILLVFYIRATIFANVHRIVHLIFVLSSFLIFGFPILLARWEM